MTTKFESIKVLSAVLKKFILAPICNVNNVHVLQAVNSLLTQSAHIHSELKPPSTVALEDHSRNISITGESRRACWGARRSGGMIAEAGMYIESIEVCTVQRDKHTVVGLCDRQPAHD